MGDAPCLFDDLERLGPWAGNAMAINRSGYKFTGNIDFWCTYHPDVFRQERWAEKRKAAGGNMDFKMLTDRKFSVSISGSSTLLGVLHGLRIFDSVVVAGAPLDAPEYIGYRVGWEAQGSTLRNRVKSLSGWTKTFLEGLNVS